MPEIEWTRTEDAPVKEKFGGTVRVRTLWQSEGAAAQIVELDPALAGEIDLHEPGPEEVYVVSDIFNDGVRDYPAGSFIHNPTGSSRAAIEDRLHFICLSRRLERKWTSPTVDSLPKNLVAQCSLPMMNSSRPRKSSRPENAHPSKPNVPTWESGWMAGARRRRTPGYDWHHPSRCA
jgi:hypothetical protein